MIAIIIILLLLLIVHIAWGAYVIIKLTKSAEFTRQQKRNNILLIIFVPLLWATLIYYMLKKLPEGYKFEPEERFTHNDFHESGKGSPGMRGF